VTQEAKHASGGRAIRKQVVYAGKPVPGLFERTTHHGRWACQLAKRCMCRGGLADLRIARLSRHKKQPVSGAPGRHFDWQLRAGGAQFLMPGVKFGLVVFGAIVFAVSVDRFIDLAVT
jgi:hypothetical protein